MDRHAVNFRKDGNVAIITLNRPEVRNALSADTLEDLASALEDCKAGDVRAVVVTGSGGAFCSGADVRDFTQTLNRNPQELSGQLRVLADILHRNVVLRIRQLPKPVIASIGGVAAGGGFSLALACDLRIASQDARFVMAYSNIGATADGGSTYYLPRLLGPGLAMEAYLMNPAYKLPACPGNRAGEPHSARRRIGDADSGDCPTPRLGPDPGLRPRKGVNGPLLEL